MSDKHQELRFGLREATIEKICNVFAKHERIEKAVIYGSRAKGNYKQGSDIDLTLYGQNLTLDDLSTVMDELDDLLLPYSIDLSLFDELNNAKLREHIERVGLVFYERGDAGGIMKAGWQMKRLGEICLIQPPKSEARKNLKNSDLVSFVPMESMGIDQKYFDTSKVRALEEVAGSYTYFADGDVLLAKITPCFENGKLGIAQNLKNGVGFGSSEYIVFRGAESLHNQFLYYFLSRETFRKEGAKRMAGAVGHKRVTKEFIENILIPLPPLSEQQRIVAILDEAFEGIATAAANAKKNLNNARELFASYLQSVRAEKQPLGDLVSITTGKLDVNAFKEGGQYPFFTCSRQIYAIDTFAFDCEAILLAGNNASGDFNVKHYKGKFNAYQRTYVITVNQENKLLYRYLYFQMLNSLREFKNKSVGANTKFLKLGMIKDLRIPLPSFSEQQAIVAKLDELSTETKKLEAIYQQKLTALDELKKSILNQAFSGQLHIKVKAAA